jgi:hypothetical protein
MSDKRQTPGRYEGEKFSHSLVASEYHNDSTVADGSTYSNSATGRQDQR